LIKRWNNQNSDQLNDIWLGAKPRHVQSVVLIEKNRACKPYDVYMSPPVLLAVHESMESPHQFIQLFYIQGRRTKTCLP
jgi:hypothetical protein